MGRRVAGLLSLLCALLLVVWLAVSAATHGGSSPTTATAGAAATAWPAPPDVLTDQLQPPWSQESTGSAMEPTGIELVNAPGVESMVVDGTGAVWLHSPWQLTRVDPSSGTARSWDVADDAVFATMGSIVPTDGDGVWLVEPDRVRLFDGRSFVRDLPVPAQYRGGEGRRINGLVEVGSEVWVSSAAGVARSAGGPWTMVGDDTIDGAAMLTVDTDGRMWSVSQVLRSDGELEQTVMRFDGARWTAIDGSASPTFAEELVADPTGGVYVRFGRDVRHFDGLSWRPMPQLSSAQRLGTAAARDMSVAPDGTVWLVGPEGVARGRGSEQWKLIAQVDEPSLVGVGILGDDVMVAESSGLLRLDGDQLSRVWSAPDRGLGSAVSGLLVVSADEVWATAEGAIHQYVDGRWHLRRQGLGWLGGSRIGWGGDSGLALASDGAVWAITGGALARFAGDEPVVIPRNLADGWLLAGPDAGVWAVEAIWPGWSRWYAGEDPDGSSVSLLRADGTQMSVRLPGPPWSLTSLAAGVDGSIWVTICEEGRADYCTVPTLMRWDGQWASVPYPGAGLAGVSVAGDGAFWALITSGTAANEEPVVARYADGSWTRFTQVADRGSVSPLPSGGVCGADVVDSILFCIDPAGRASNRALPVPGHVHVGPDGSLWVEDSGVVARLPGNAPL
jgi:hypothetical protein